jgi:hypothetical protein
VEHGTAVSGGTRAGPFALLALRAGLSNLPRHEQEQRVHVSSCGHGPFPPSAQCEPDAGLTAFFVSVPSRRAPFARTYSRRGTTATHERWKERAQCDGAALGRSAWPGHRHNRARLLTTTDVATVHFIQPFIRFFAMGKRQQRFSIEFLQPFSLLSDKEATVPD